MHKKTIAALAAVISISLYSPAVLAEPVEFSGEASVKYERDKVGGSATDGMIYTITLDGKIQLSEKLQFFTVIGAQKLTNAAVGRDFVGAPTYADDDKSAVGFNQFGFAYENGDNKYKLGRQEALIGATALLYSRPSTNIGRHGYADGLTFEGKSGKTDLQGILAREDNPGSNDNQLYALRAAISPEENWTVGATLARYNDKAADFHTNHWAIDGAYSFGKHKITAEYAKSNQDQANNAYAAIWSYDFNDKTAASVTAFRVEANADMGGGTDFENNQRGFYYGLTHKFDDSRSVEAILKKFKDIDTREKTTTIETRIIYAF